MGFVKGFNIAEVKQLTQSISKTSGIFWIITAALFVFTGLMLVMKNNYWWLFGITAIVISQILIVMHWQDAKFGSIANVIILITCITGYAQWNFSHKFRTDVNDGFKQTENVQPSILTESDMEHLPEPVKRYLRYTGSVGKPKVSNFKIEFKGKIRKDEKSELMPFTSEQFNFMEKPTRLFFMNAVMKHLPVAGYHQYKNGNASMDIRMFSLIRVQFNDGDEMNKAETVTFFNDMCCMAPATLIDKRISWRQERENEVEAMFTVNNITISARLYFNDKGELINFKSNDRFNADEGKLLPWSTPLKNYREINGYRLAGYAETLYSYPEKKCCYGTFETVAVSYNRK